MSLKSSQLDGHEKKHLEQVSEIAKLKNEISSANQLASSQTAQIADLKTLVEDLKNKEARES